MKINYRLTHLFVMLIFLVVSKLIFAQEPIKENAHVVLISPCLENTGNGILLYANRFFIDDEYMGKLILNRFYKFDVTPGKHTFSVNSKKTAEPNSNPNKINIEYTFKSGKTYYLYVNHMDISFSNGFDRFIYVITKETADYMLNFIEKEDVLEK